jgi:crotonobetainyl-CoA:carnitine CoA-transferase CaiB-like acyl-CoA transferase
MGLQGGDMWPLEGIKVVDLSQNVAGPYSAAEMATVLKIEPPGGDPTRSWGPPFWAGHSPSFMVRT